MTILVSFIAGTFWIGYLVYTIKKSRFLTSREKNTAFCILFLSLILIVLSIDRLSDIPKLIIPMVIRSDVALILWAKAHKLLWQTAFCYVAINTIGAMVIYATADLSKHYFDKSEHKFPQLLKFHLLFRKIWHIIFSNCVLIQKISSYFGNYTFVQEIREIYDEVKNVLLNLRNFRKRLSERIEQWTRRTNLILVFLVFLIPIPIPWIGTIIIVGVRYKNIKGGLWALLLANAIKSSIFVLMIWRGFHI